MADLYPAPPYRRPPGGAALVTATKAMDLSPGTQAGEWARALAGHGDPFTTERAYAVQGWFRRCVVVIGDTLADVPWAIHPLGAAPDADPAWDSESPDVPEALLPFKGLRRFVFKTAALLSIGGIVHALKERERGRFTGLLWWRPGTVEHVYDGAAGPPYRGIRQFKRTVNGVPVVYAPEDVLMIAMPDPFVEVGVPSSDGDAARINADVLHSLDTFLDGYLDRGLLRATLLTSEQPLTPEQKSELKRWWDRMFGGKKKAGVTEVMNSKIVPITVGEGVKDLGADALTDAQREAVSNALGLPLSVAKGDAANYATASVEERGFYTRTILPRCNVIQDALNDHLFNELGYTFRFLPKKLEVMQVYELEKAAQVSLLVGGPVLTREEGRELMGRPPVPLLGEFTPPPATGPPSGGGDGAMGRPPVPRTTTNGEAPGKGIGLRVREILEGGL